MEESLWGSFDDIESDILDPRDFIAKQFDILSGQFDGLVGGEAVKKPVSKGSIQYYEDMEIGHDFRYDFHIISKYVSNYKYRVCSATYGIAFYPLELEIPEGQEKEMKERLRKYKKYPIRENGIIVESEEDLKNVLRELFATNEIRNVIKGLLTIAKKEKDEFDRLL